MLQLKKLRKELGFNKEISGIINVLKGVASSEFYRLQKARKALDEFMNYLQSFFQLFDIRQLEHSFLGQSSLPPAIVLITSDAGFLGKLNVSIVNAALEQCTSASRGEKLIIVGDQGVRYISETGRDFISFPGISDEIDYDEAVSLADVIFRGVLNGEFSRTVVIYPRFVSFTSWTIHAYQLLPCRFLFQEGSARSFEEEEKIIIEPTRSKVLEYLIKTWLNYMFYGIFWESKLSEWSARTMHLESSAEEIKRSDKRMRFKYFRALHEVSDKNIREIFSSRSAMGHRV